MSRLKYMATDLTCDQINDWFKISGPKINVAIVPQSKLGGNLLDPKTGGPAVVEYRKVLPSYKRHLGSSDSEQRAYAEPIRRQEEESFARQFSQMRQSQGNWNPADDETSSMTSGIENVHDTISTVATLVDEHSHGVRLPEGMTQDDAIKVYEQYNTRHQYDPKLPITQCHEDIVDLIESQQVTVIQGETGSGKTTQVAQYILDHYAANNRYCNIVVTQPRRIAAISIARRVCAERGWQLGRICGYQIGMEREASEDTRLLYCTTGVLLQKLIGEKNMHQFTHVILDEVHERDQESDFCLLVVKKLLRKNSRDVKVVLMSATIDSDLFASYFSRPVGGKLEKAPVYKVQGHIYDVAEFYLEDLAELGALPRLEAHAPAVTPEALDLAVKLILTFDNIEKKNNQTASGVRGSVLVFLPGIEEISRMDSKLRPLTHNHNLLILPLHSSITGEEQVRVFDRPTAGARKVILSTNIAESSITVPDIRYVIDFCLTKMEVCDPETNYSSLQLQWASKANCKQRRGRAGRVSQGRVYRLVTHKFWMEDLPDYGIPEMQRSSLSQLILKVKMLDLGEPKAILALALSPPRLDGIERTIVLLKEAGALASLQYCEVNPHDGELTFLGKVLASLPVDIHLSKLMMLGYVFGVLEETIIISAAHSLNSFFSRPFKSEIEAYKHKLAWATDTFSDSLCHLHAFRAWRHQVEIGAFRSNADEAKWGKDNFIQIRQIKLVSKLVEELTKRLKNLNVYKLRRRSQQTPTSNSAHDEIILKLVLCGAFYPNYFEEVPSDERLADREMSGYNPFTTVMVKGLPPNQGHLYRADLEDIFTACDGRRVPRIHFEETRAFIEFYKDPGDTSANKVQLAVYVALKMRHNRSLPLQITLHDSHTAFRLMSAFSTKQDDRKLRSNLIDDNPASGPQQVTSPSSHTNHMTILVGKVVSCGRFWAYAADAATERKMAQMHIQLQQFVNSQLYSANSSQSQNYKIGDYCLAPYVEDGQKLYFRARIEKLQRNIATVFFIDYGNTADANVQELCQMHPMFHKLPFQAFECELCQLKPSPIKCPNGQWTPEAQNRFQQFVDAAKVFIIKVFSIVHGVLRVELIANINESEVNINSELIRMNYADIAEESYLSIQNHERRELESFSQRPQAYSSMTRDLPVSLNEAAQDTRDRSAVNSSQRFGDKLTLKGPWNSYEIGFAGCTFSSKRRPVRVEKDSINSVAVNGELGVGANEVKTASRMLIAASVTLNSNGDSLTARNTTLMPPIPGLLTLVALAFAPSAELRTDKDKTRYTGALCGLGWDMSSYEGDSAYPDHDMEITSDFDFTIADLTMINSVRMAINFALNGDCGPEAMENVQKKAREQLLKLIETKRTPITPTPYRNQYRWRQVDPDDIISPSVQLTNETALYNLHSGIALNEPLQEHEGESRLSHTHVSAISASGMTTQQKQAHNNWLKSKASKSTEPEKILCRLCNRNVHTPYELTVHLTSVMHRKNSDLL